MDAIKSKYNPWAPWRREVFVSRSMGFQEVYPPPRPAMFVYKSPRDTVWIRLV